MDSAVVLELERIESEEDEESEEEDSEVDVDVSCATASATIAVRIDFSNMITAQCNVFNRCLDRVRTVAHTLD